MKDTFEEKIAKIIANFVETEIYSSDSADLTFKANPDKPKCSCCGDKYLGDPATIKLYVKLAKRVIKAVTNTK